MITLPTSSAYALNSSAFSVNKPVQVQFQDETATLRDALKQALNKLTDYKNQLDAADRAIVQLKKERKLAQDQRDAGTLEIDAANRVIKNAETSIKALQSEKEELIRQSTIYEKQVKNLEKRLARSETKVKVYKTLAVIGTAAGVVLGIFLSRGN